MIRITIREGGSAREGRAELPILRCRPHSPHDVIPAISFATVGMQRALDRFSRAADAVVGAAEPTTGVAGENDSTSGDAVGVVEGFLEMDLARLAFIASLRTAETSNEILEEAIRLGRYDS